ncbi:MAG: discoidin domain-containing protein, partial [Sedimentisphaerales bacterium]|nr:discoidin domain-containing protein [Sedimentisphaerales bacterium]
MCRKCFFLIFIIFILGFGIVTRGDIINRYSFTDGDTVAVDSISGRDGTLEGSASISGNQLVLDGNGAVNLPGDILDPSLQSVTIEAWFEISADSSWQALFDFGGTDAGGTGGNCICFTPTSGDNTARFYISTNDYPSWQTGEDRTNADEIAVDTPTHVACVYDGATSEIRLYIDGVLEDSTPLTTMELSQVERMFAYIGDSLYTADPYFQGTIDEFRIYDTALTDEEVLGSFEEGPDADVSNTPRARYPYPADEQTDVTPGVILGWNPGQLADTHNVYLGTVYDDVDNANAGSPLLVSPAQDANTYAPVNLELGQTYYWRVDEVNAPPDSGVIKGVVWSFTVETFTYTMTEEQITATASSQGEGEGPENTIDSSGLVDDKHSILPATMWLTPEGQTGPAWIQYEFDKTYKLHEMLVWNYNGPSILWWYGLKEVAVEYSTDGTNWDLVPDVNEFAKATGRPAYASNTTVPFNGVAAKYVRITATSNWSNGLFDQYGLSEVRF